MEPLGRPVRKLTKEAQGAVKARGHMLCLCWKKGWHQVKARMATPLQTAAVNLKVRWPFIWTLALLLMNDIIALAQLPPSPHFLISKTWANHLLCQGWE